MLAKKDQYFRLIKEFYGDRKSVRSGIPYMNHIIEGLLILDYLNASEATHRAFCIHPILQNDLDIPVSRSVFDGQVIDPWVLILAMEYRSVANDYLSKETITDINEIRLSPLLEVNDMLMADKIQNSHDFEANYLKYDNAKELRVYFSNWHKRLGLTDDLIVKCYQYIGYRIGELQVSSEDKRSHILDQSV